MAPPISIVCANIYPQFDSIAFMLRNLAAQSYRDFELVIVDAHYEMNATGVRDLCAQFELKNVIHAPAMEARHVGRWMHWELYSNALLLSSSPWAVYHGVHRYLHRRALEIIVDKAAHGIATVLLQNNVPDSSLVSFNDIEEANCMSVYCEPWPYLSNTGFFSIQRDVMLHTLNGYNEALTLHHWADTDLSQRALHLRTMKVELMRAGLLRIAHPKDSGKENRHPYHEFPLCKLPCSYTVNPNCIIHQIDHMVSGQVRRIQVPVKRIVHRGFEWVQCDQCGCLGIEDEGEYVNHFLTNPDNIKAPIGVGGIGRNLATLDSDLLKLEFSSKIDLIASSHTNERYLQ